TTVTYTLSLHDALPIWRWLPLGFANLQPSELMKVCAVLYAADYTVRKAAFMHSLRKGFLPMAGVMLLTGGLLLREPDFGAFAVRSEEHTSELQSRENLV